MRETRSCVKILAFVDVHVNRLALRELERKARDADLLVCAGDLSIFGRGLAETMEIIDSWGKPCLLIHGNHEEEEETRKRCERSRNLTFIHGKELVVGSFSVAGWGGGGFSRRDKAFEKWARTLTPRPGRILVTHAPPFGTAIDIQPYMNAHVGCASYTEAIDALKPAVMIAGHIHECFGEHEQRGETLILNPGPLGVMLTLDTSESTQKKTVTEKKNRVRTNIGKL
jgi:Icc-related predicted phosphoesterase